MQPCRVCEEGSVAATANHDASRFTTPPRKQELVSEEVGSALQGLWQDDEGTKVTISGSMMHGPDGGRLACSFIDKNTISFKMGGEIYEGKFDGIKLLWNDGAVWTRPETKP